MKKNTVYLQSQNNGPVAQLDRASDYGSEGWGFDSSQVHNVKLACYRKR